MIVMLSFFLHDVQLAYEALTKWTKLICKIWSAKKLAVKSKNSIRHI